MKNLEEVDRYPIPLRSADLIDCGTLVPYILIRLQSRLDKGSTA